MSVPNARGKGVACQGTVWLRPCRALTLRVLLVL